MIETPHVRSTTLQVRVVDRTFSCTIEVNGTAISSEDVNRLLDDCDVPEGTPYLTDGTGQFHTLQHVNDYLLDAARQRAYPLTALRGNHAGALRRLLESVRERKPDADLTDTTREDLVKYSERRRREITGSSWNTELSNLANFFSYAHERGWVDVDPNPRWGKSQRSTLKSPERTSKRIRFLTEDQLRHFLTRGLRGDATPTYARPEYPERDYAFGITVVSTGLRREEATYLLDLEIPSNLNGRGEHIFERVGKGNKPRDVQVVYPLADAIDHYRRGEREHLIERSQRSLRDRRRKGMLTVAEIVHTRNGLRLRIDDRIIRPERLPNHLRRTAVQIRDDGTIEPLALFLAEGGKGPAIDRFNRLFQDANYRLALLGPHEHAPPAHLKVTPHVLRHTFAVRTLASLMRLGRDTAGDPYALLASPILVVQELLGHTDLSTTHRYLYLAERYTDQVPNALRDGVLRLIEGL